ncbi:uncharacterized protein C8A04DRAFT_27189 [Dichotomopilus funicola]|uniref:Uncharacterized protein n=1 Tax=Dichotomopilus funicola TaxID=1934379 RepID=A0AAN6V565_9PEZI|nr:hypothetical protein C8A04DRAFT_27189 [Dichotomopilus funicola]
MKDIEQVLAAGMGDSALRSDSTGLLTALEAAYSEAKQKFHVVADLFEEVLKLKNRGRSRLSALRSGIVFINKGDNFMTHYQSLRDSASLARDLASDLKVEMLWARMDARFNERLVDIDIRVTEQLTQLTGSMATLLLDEEDEENDAQPTTNHSGDTKGLQGISSSNNTSGRGGFRKMARIGRKMVELSETGFTQSIALIIDTAPVPGSEPGTSVSRQKEIMAIGKLDTASDANLVSYEMLIDSGLREELLVPIPPYKIELHGLEGAKCTPQWEVTLQWYRPRDMKRRKEKFYVVKNALFEVLFSSDSSFKQISDRSVHLSLDRFKRKKEVLVELQAEDENRKKALERVEREYREAEAMKRVPVRKDTGLGETSRETISGVKSLGRLERGPIYKQQLYQRQANLRVI